MQRHHKCTLTNELHTDGLFCVDSWRVLIPVAEQLSAAPSRSYFFFSFHLDRKCLCCAVLVFLNFFFSSSSFPLSGPWALWEAWTVLGIQKRGGEPEIQLQMGGSRCNLTKATHVSLVFWLPRMHYTSLGCHEHAYLLLLMYKYILSETFLNRSKVRGFFLPQKL